MEDVAQEPRMTGPEDKTLEIAGHTFTHKPYTLKNREAYMEKVKEIRERADEGEELTDFDYYIEVLPFVAEGPTDEVTKYDIEGRSFERFEQAFFPRSRQVLSGLMNFSIS